LSDKHKQDEELEQYRSLMERPDTFEEGFTLRTVIGAFFVGFIMMPGAIYMGLIAGVSMGPAAEWVTIILFSELARRSFSPLTRQEIYVIYYVAGGLAGVISGGVGGMMIAGGPFGQLIWNQYLVQSQAVEGFGIAQHIPEWVAPLAGSEALVARTFFHYAWLPAVAVLVASQVLSRAEWFSLGYILFRITSDIERLPFPLAPVAAQGAMALAEGGEDEAKESWRWRVFSIGMGIGLLFGAVYVGLPALTGLIASDPIALLPIPWIDLTTTTESFLPAAPLGIGTDLGLVIIGMVLPFWVVVGSFAAAMVHALGSPVLYHAGYLTHWRPGMDTILTHFSNDIDVWMSVYIGSGAMVGIIGLYHAFRSIGDRQKETAVGRGTLSDTPAGRGDFPFWGAVGVYLLATLAMILLCLYLLEDDDFPLLFLIAFGFLLTPLLSYINARMAGLTGQTVGFPMIREGAFIFSGYKGVDIWFVPIPYADHGRRAQLFREVELTGTKFTSILKAELLVLPMSLICGLIFWSLIWLMAPIPSPVFQYAQNYWHLIALRQSLWYSATLPGVTDSLFSQAIKWEWITGGFVFTAGSYFVLSFMRMPVSLIYGFIRGLQGLPHMLIPEMVGALIGRYYFENRFGVRQWRQYAPVIFAGFACGMGLIGMSSVAIALISKSVTQLRY
jgi:hypothetical protein